MSDLLYVCTGNVCRSPFAERLTQHRLDAMGATGWTVRSAGIAALAGHDMETLMAEQLELRGGSAAGFRARQLDVSEVAETDLVVALSSTHRDWILEESPRLLHRTFTLGQIVRFAQEEAPDLRGAEFLDALRAHRSRARRRDDVPDPYRRGPEAAASCAAVITSMLDVLVPRLGAGA